MKKTILYLLITIITFVIPGCSGYKYNVISIKNKPTKLKKDGVYYALPQTVVTVDISLRKIDKIKGPYSEYASKYLGLSNVINCNSTSYEIDEIKIGSSTIRDPEHFYFVELSKTLSRNKNNFMMELSESGLIYSFNDKVMNNADVNSVTIHEESVKSTDISGYLADENLFERIDTIIELVNLDTITIEKKILKKSLVEKTTEQKAKEAADFLMRVKEDKFNLITGYNEVNYEKETMKYMKEELDDLEEKYLKLFTGITATKIINYKLTYIPKTNETSEPIALCTFSPKNGITDTSSEDGDNIYLVINRKNDTKAMDEFIKNKDKYCKNKKHGFYYRIPEYAEIYVRQEDALKSDTVLLINQFGIVTNLLPIRSKIQFYPNSGAVKSISNE